MRAPYSAILFLLAIFAATASAIDHPLQVGPSVHPIAVVATLDQLRHQPLLHAGPGTTVRLGIQSTLCHPGSGVLLYCLVESFQPCPFHDGQDLLPSERWLGPVRVEVPCPPDSVGTQPTPPGNDDDDPDLSPQPPEKVGTARLYTFLIAGLDARDLPVTVSAADGTAIGHATINCVGTEAHPWFALNTIAPADGTTPARVAIANGLPVMPLWGYANGIAPARTLPRYEPAEMDSGFTLARTQSGVSLKCAQPFHTSPHGRLLTRWWVNGNPVEPKSGAPAPATSPDEPDPAASQLALQIDLKPDDLRAQPGDEIALQCLYIEGGWESASPTTETPAAHHPAIADPSATAPAARLSNRIHWTLKQPAGDGAATNAPAGPNAPNMPNAPIAPAIAPFESP